VHFCLQPYLPCYYPYISFIYCTCWVPTISVLNLAIFALQLKPAAQKEKMDWNSSTRSSRLRVALVAVPVVYGVFRCSILLRVIIVFRDIIYVIIILYSWHLVICELFWPYVWNNWSWGMHTMSTWFWHKTGYDTHRPCLASTQSLHSSSTSSCSYHAHSTNQKHQKQSKFLSSFSKFLFEIFRFYIMQWWNKQDVEKE
jgi:hypothetical protein